MTLANLALLLNSTANLPWAIAKLVSVIRRPP